MKKIKPEIEELYITWEGINYLISINYKDKKIWCSEIDSFNYQGTGRLRLKNPAFEMKHKTELLKLINKIPKNQQLYILNSIKKDLQKESPKNSKAKLEQNVRGRPKSVALIKVTFWTMENQQSGESYANVNRRAYSKFKPKDIREIDFGRMINRERKAIHKAFSERKNSLEEKDPVTLQIFKKDYLQHHRNIEKQRLTKKA